MNITLLVALGAALAGQVETRPYDATPGLPPPTLAQMVAEPEYRGELKITSIQAARDAAKVALPGGMMCDPATLDAMKAELMKLRPAEAILSAKSATSGTMRLKVIAEDEKMQADPVDIDFRYDPKTGQMTADTNISGWHLTMDVQAAYRGAGTPPYRNANFVFAGKLTATTGPDDAIRIDMLVRAKSVKSSTLEKPVAPPGEERQDASPPVRTPVRPPPTVIRVDAGVRFSGVSGQVDIRPHDDEDAWKVAGLKSVIYLDDHIRTGDDSTCILSFSDMTTFVMKPNSEVVIDTPPEKDSKLALVFGKIWVNVKKMIKDGTMEVQMSQAVAGIKGTVFASEETGTESITKVFAGELSVTAYATGETRQVKAGQMVRVTRNGFEDLQPFDVPQEQSEWAKIDPSIGKAKYGDSGAGKATGSAGFAGAWDSNFGRVELRVTSNRVVGAYSHDRGRINGVLSDDGRTLTGTWSEAPSYQPPKDAGRMELTLSPDGKGFTGRWGYGDDFNFDRWTATRVAEPSAEPERPRGEEAQQPRLGFSGTLVDLDPRIGLPTSDELPSRGMRAEQVTVGTPAAKLGLERGDIVISIDSMRFTSQAGYLHALQCAGQRPSLILYDARNGRLVRRSIDLPHTEMSIEEAVPQPPDSYLMSIDLADDMR